MPETPRTTTTDTTDPTPAERAFLERWLDSAGAERAKLTGLGEADSTGRS